MTRDGGLIRAEPRRRTVPTTLPGRSVSVSLPRVTSAVPILLPRKSDITMITNGIILATWRVRTPGEPGHSEPQPGQHG